MLCSRKSELGRLLILTVCSLPGSIFSSFVDEKQTMENNSSPPAQGSLNPSLVDGNQTVQDCTSPPTQVTVSLSVLVDTKAELSCPALPVTPGYLSIWKILLRDNTSCYRAYRRDGNDTKETNCTVKGISWVSSPEQPLALHIDPVTIMHYGLYTCEIAISGGNFHRDYDLRVLVPPEVSLVGTEPGTALCQALSGKPAAQISWTPEGNCDTEQVTQGNGTVSVRSSCRWKDSNVSTVICSVSHVTGNRNLSLVLHPGDEFTKIYAFKYIIRPVLTTSFIISVIYCLSATISRKCKQTKLETIQALEKDEMQPYASCTGDKQSTL